MKKNYSLISPYFFILLFSCFSITSGVGQTYTTGVANWTQVWNASSGRFDFTNGIGMFSFGSTSEGQVEGRFFTTDGTLNGTQRTVKPGQKIIIRIAGQDGGGRSGIVNDGVIGISIKSGGGIFDGSGLAGRYDNNSILKIEFVGGQSTARFTDGSGFSTANMPNFSSFKSGTTYEIEVISDREFNLVVGSNRNNIRSFGGSGSVSPALIHARNSGANMDGLFTLLEVVNQAINLTANGSEEYTVTGVISNNESNSNTVVKNGSGTVILTNQNTYTGSTTINSGTLRLNRTGGTTLPSSNSVTVNGGTLRVSSNQTLTSLTLTSGGLTIDNDVTLTLPNGLSIPEGFTITNNGTLLIEGTLTDNRTNKTFGGTVNYNGGNQTIVGANYTNLTLSGSGTKTFSANSVISGNFTNTGVEIITPSLLTFNGSSAQSLTGANFNSIHFEGNSKTFTSNATVSSTGAITFGTGSGTIDFDGSSNNLDFILKSDSNGTARVGQIESFTLSGNVTTQRYIPLGKRAFRFLTSTVNTTESIRANWQANGSTTSGIGTQITGSGGVTNGFDASNTNNPSLFFYNNQVASGTGWTAVSNTNSTLLEAGVGYRILIRGDRNVDLGAAAAADMNQSVTLNTKGTLKTGTVVYSDSSSPVAINNTSNTTTDSYSLVGNPFMSPIDWHTLGKTGLVNSYYAWDANMGTSTQRGRYVVYSQTSGTNNNASSEVGRYIQPGQAFFVRNETVGTAGTLIIQESDKSNTSNTNVFREASNFNSKLNVLIYEPNVLSLGGYPIDGTVAVFGSNFSEMLDFGDVAKLNVAGENIALSRENTNLAIEAFQIPQTDDELFLKLLQFTASKTYSFKITADSFGETTSAYLVDNFLNTWSEIDLNSDYIHPFNTTSDIASYHSDRFKIVFNPSTLSSSEFNSSLVSVYPNPIQNNQFNVHFQEALNSNVNISVTSILGQKIPFKSNSTSNGIAIELNQTLSSGIYFLELESNGNKITKKIIVN